MTDKESLYASGGHTVFTSGGEEDLLALYLHRGREFLQYNIINKDTWKEFSRKSEYLAKKKEDKISYFWDRLIEIISEDFENNNLLAEDFQTKVTLIDVEKTLRIMAKEDRFNRRMLSKAFIEFLDLTMKKKIESRLIPGFSSVLYVFLALPYEDRKFRAATLAQRCFVARGLHKEYKTVIGIATEPYKPNSGYSLDTFYLHQEDWLETDQKELESLQERYEYFKNPTYKQVHEDEYPQSS